MKKILMIILLVSTISKAQDFKLGFDAELHQVRISMGNGILGGNGLPLSIHFISGYDFLKDISLQSKIGRTFHVEFAGWEFGLSVKYFIYQPFYLTTGYLYHYNEGGNNGISSGHSYADLSLIRVGGGIFIMQFMSIGIEYYFPIRKKEIGWIRHENEEMKYYSFEGLIRLSFIFDWKL